MSISINKSEQSVQFVNTTTGKLCGTYHYEDMYKSFFRGLYTPGGKDVVACPPPEHLHHHGLQFGLTTDLANFWEEDQASEPDKNPKLPIGKQQTARLDLLPTDDGTGFIQLINWVTGDVCVFNETRMISVVEAAGAYIWSWEATLIAPLQSVQIIKSVWDAPSYCHPQYGYCGIGLRLARDLFKDGEVFPSGTQCGEPPTSVSFRGTGAEVTFAQNSSQGDALFVTTYQNVGPYPGGPGFAFLGLVPTPRTIDKGNGLEVMYTIKVSDV